MLNRRSILATGAIAAVPLAAPWGALAKTSKDTVVLAMTLATLIVVAFPQISLWLPTQLGY